MIDNKLEMVVIEARNELVAARLIHKSMKSSHEGYAVILEEMDELWEEVKKNPKKHPEAKEKMRQEAIQVAAMAMRFVIDVCGEGRMRVYLRITLQQGIG